MTEFFIALGIATSIAAVVTLCAIVWTWRANKILEDETKEFSPAEMAEIEKQREILRQRYPSQKEINETVERTLNK